MVASLHTLLVMKVRKEPKEAIKVSEVTASHYIMCKSPWSFFHQLQYMQQPTGAPTMVVHTIMCSSALCSLAS